MQIPRHGSLTLPPRELAPAPQLRLSAEQPESFLSCDPVLPRMGDIDQQPVCGNSIAFVRKWSDALQAITFGQQVICNVHNLFKSELARADVEKKTKLLSLESDHRFAAFEDRPATH